MGSSLASRVLLSLLPGCVLCVVELPPPYEIPICRYSYDAANGGLAPHVHEDADSDPRWWLQPKCPVGGQCTREFSQLSDLGGEGGGTSEAALGACDIPRIAPREVSTARKMMKHLAAEEPFIISDLPAPASAPSKGGAASGKKEGNLAWAPKWPNSASLSQLKEALGPRRLVAPQCTVINGSSFSNYRGKSGQKEGLLSCTCEMAWESVLDAIFLEKPLPVAARFLEGEASDEGGNYIDLEPNNNEEAIVRRPVKLQKRVQFKDISDLVLRILQGIPMHIWGGWNFANRNASLLFMGSRDTRTPLHKDGFNSMIIQLNGTKHWTLISDKVAKEAGGASPLAELTSSLERGPLLLEEAQRTALKARSCVLRPFEIMYLPGSYWHDVYSITPGASLSVRFVDEFDQILSQAKLM